MSAKRRAPVPQPPTPRVATRAEMIASASGVVELRIVDCPASWKFSLEPARGAPGKCLELEFSIGSVLLDAGDCLQLAEKLNALGQVMVDMQKAQR